MKLSHKILIILALGLTIVTFAGCDKDKAPSLILPTESTTKEKFDEEKFREEYERTSVYTPEETTQAETESTTEETTTKKETTTIKEAVTELTTLITTVATTKPKESKPVTTTEAYVVDTRNESKETKTTIQYGVVQIDVVSTYYDIYSDGTEVQTKQLTYTKYDSSKFKASTDDLLSEAKTNRAKYSAEIREAYEETNKVRSDAGVPALTLNEDLCTAACVRALECAYTGSLEHKRPNGSSCDTVLSDLGIEWTGRGENVAKGYTDGTQAIQAFKKSSAHYKNMVSEEFTDIGIGVAAAPDGTLYWCMILTVNNKDAD